MLRIRISRSSWLRPFTTSAWPSTPCAAAPTTTFSSHLNASTWSPRYSVRWNTGRPCRRAAPTSRIWNRWCGHAPRCFARPWKTWSTPTTSRSRLLGDALDLKDSETEGHSKRVTAYTIALARAMGISPAEIKVIARGAFLHDIGKMAIPDDILRKPGKLTPEEQEIMREHCARGYQMLRKIPFLAEAAEIVFTHQEHYDGTGYPSALKGCGYSGRRPHIRSGRHARRHHQRSAVSRGAHL